MATSKGNTTYILLHDCKVLGAWSNLKHLCEDVKKDNPKFSSYWTLAKMDKNDGILNFTSKDGKEYTIKIEEVK